MNNRIPNGIGLRREMEERYRIGLNAAGSYVLSSLDGDELDHLKRVNFAAVSWSPEEHVLIVRGTEKRGLLVRFAQLSLPDGRFCRFSGPRYLSPRLLRTEPIAKPEFVASIIESPTLRIFKLKEMREYVGLLVGPRAAGYKSLLTLEGDRLRLVDIEESPPPQSRELTRVIEEKPPAGEAMRERLRTLFA